MANARRCPLQQGGAGRGSAWLTSQPRRGAVSVHQQGEARVSHGWCHCQQAAPSHLSAGRGSECQGGHHTQRVAPQTLKTELWLPDWGRDAYFETTGEQTTPLPTTRSNVVGRGGSIQNKGRPQPSFGMKAVYGLHFSLWIYTSFLRLDNSWTKYHIHISLLNYCNTLEAWESHLF